jgi:peptidoglycan/xylan/chitin deacetylase (PgdA/CDA1 family)
LWRCPPAGVALTFDDGPDPERTPPLLDLLLDANVRASFFVIGEKAARWPAIVRRMASEGHTIGNHSWSHRSFPRLTSRGIDLELGRCNKVLESTTGLIPRFVRAPYGRRDPRFYSVARRFDLTPVFWSIDTFDWAGTSVKSAVRRASRARPGDIVLMHDGDRRASATLGAVRHLLAHQQSLGLHVAPLDDLIPRTIRLAS